MSKRKIKSAFPALAEAFVECRSLGHDWQRQLHDPEWTGTLNVSKESRRSYRCSRCTSFRREIWGLFTGKVTARHYTYAAGYELSADDYATMSRSGSTMREAMRMELLAREAALVG